jgi:hypothetical protein
MTDRFDFRPTGGPMTQKHNDAVGHTRSRFRFLPALILCAGVLIAPRAQATMVGGVPIADTYQIDGHTLVLNGAALRTLTVLKVNIYIVALYLPQKMHDAAAILASKGPKVAVVHYVHSGTRDQVRDRYRVGEKNNCGNGACDPTLEPDFERLVNAAVAVEPGDTTTFAVRATGLQVSFNGRPFEPFGKAALGNQIINGFIGPHAPTPEFRATLLGVPAP